MELQPREPYPIGPQPRVPKPMRLQLTDLQPVFIIMIFPSMSLWVEFFEALLIYQGGEIF